MKPFLSRMIPSIVGAALFCLISAPTSTLSADLCASLTPAQASRLQTLTSKIHAYDGCDMTLSKCMKVASPHFSVQHAVQDVCRLITKNKSDLEIEKALTQRAESRMPPLKKLSFRDDPGTSAGDPNSPVIAVVYACARCPFCKVLVPMLYRAVTEGSLKGKVRVVFRPFPLKNHEGALEGGLAMEAAASLGKFWPMLNLIYSRYDTFNPASLSNWAEEAGLPRAAFDAAYISPETRKSLIDSKQEGLVAKVSATPTLFINGTQYVYDMTFDVLEDVLQEVYESTRVQKKVQ